MQSRRNQVLKLFHRKNKILLSDFKGIITKHLICHLLLFLFPRLAVDEDIQFYEALLFYTALFNYLEGWIFIGEEDNNCYVHELKFLKAQGFRMGSIYLGELLNHFYWLNQIIIINWIIIFSIFYGNINLNILEASTILLYYFSYSLVITGQLLFFKSLQLTYKEMTHILMLFFTIFIFNFFVFKLDEAYLHFLPSKLLINFIFNQFYLEIRNYEFIIQDLIIIQAYGVIMILISFLLDSYNSKMSNFQKIMILLSKKISAVASDEALEQEFIIQEESNQVNQENKIISFENVFHFDNYNLLLDNLSIDFYKNSINLLIGDEMAAKAIKNILYSQILPQKGKISFRSQNILNQSKNLSDHTFYVNDKTLKIMEDLTIKENLLFFGSIYHSKVDYLQHKIMDALEKFELNQPNQMVKDLKDDPEKISVLLAIAWIQNKEIIIFRNFYYIFQKDEVQRRLKEQKYDLCIIIITEFSQVILGDEIIVLKEGKLVASGSLDSINKQLNIGYNIRIQESEESEFSMNQFQTLLNDLKIDDQIYIIQESLEIIIPFELEKQMMQVIEHLEQINGIQISFEMIQLKDAYFKQIDQQFIQPIDDQRIFFNDFQPQKIFQRQIEGLLLRRFWLEKQRRNKLISFIIIDIILTIFQSQFDIINDIVISEIYFQWKIIMTFWQLKYLFFDNQYGNKQLLYISGVSIYKYWSINLLFDTILNILIQILISLFILIFNIICFNLDINIDQIIQLTFINFLNTLWITCCSYITQYFVEFNPKGYLILIFFHYILNQICELVFAKAHFLIALRAARLKNLFQQNDDTSNKIEFLFIITFCIFIFVLVILIDRLVILHAKRKNPLSILQNYFLHLNEKMIVGILKMQNSRLRFTIQNHVLYCFRIYLKNTPLFENQFFQQLALSLIPQSAKLILKFQNSEQDSVLKSLQLYNELTLKQYFSIFGLIQGRDDQSTNIIIQKFCHYMDVRMNVQFKNLTFQEKRKALLGIQLSVFRNCLILDEPTKGLNIIDKRKCWRLIQEHKEIVKDQIFIFSKSCNEIENICDMFWMSEEKELKYNSNTNLFLQQINDTYLVQFDKKVDDLQSIIIQAYDESLVPLSCLGDSKFLIQRNKVNISFLLQFCQSLMTEDKVSKFIIQEGTLQNIYNKVCLR